MEASIIQQGLDLMVFGMGTVFVFLTVLILCTFTMSAIVTRFFPDTVTDTGIESPGSIKLGRTKSSVDPKVLAIIQEAISQHRAKTK